MGRSFAAKNTSNYNCVHYGDIVYTKSPTGDFPLGIVKQSLIKEDVIVSPLYGVFTPQTFELGAILDFYFSSPINANNYLHPVAQKGAKNTINITNKKFLSAKLRLPIDVKEQKKIAQFLQTTKKEMTVLQEILENYKKTIDKYNRKAYFYLRHAGEYRLGYDLFAYVLELEPTNRTAKLGRLLSLANLSTTRRNRFTEVRELMDIERPLFHDKTFTREYTAYLISLNSCIDVYCMLLRKNLTIKDYFYDVACIKLYYRHIADAILLKRMII